MSSFCLNISIEKTCIAFSKHRLHTKICILVLTLFEIKVERNSSFWKYILCTDEALFTRNGYYNHHNAHCRVKKNRFILTQHKSANLSL